jgi:hypothetical protein
VGPQHLPGQAVAGWVDHQLVVENCDEPGP